MSTIVKLQGDKKTLCWVADAEIRKEFAGDKGLPLLLVASRRDRLFELFFLKHYANARGFRFEEDELVKLEAQTTKQLTKKERDDRTQWWEDRRALLKGSNVREALREEFHVWENGKDLGLVGGDVTNRCIKLWEKYKAQGEDEQDEQAVQVGYEYKSFTEFFATHKAALYKMRKVYTERKDKNSIHSIPPPVPQTPPATPPQQDHPQQDLPQTPEFFFNLTSLTSPMDQ